MQKKLIRTEKVSPEEDDKINFILEYYLTQDEHAFKSGNINYVCYGIEIKMRKENEIEYCEIQSVDEIFSSMEVAVKFLNRLADSQVTPCTLKDIVSDMLLEALS